MRSGIPALIFVFCCCLAALEARESPALPGEPMSTAPLWRRALGGSIDAFPAQGPGGDVYVVADDRALHSIDPLTGNSNWIYRPGGRLRNLLMVAPDGSIYVQNDRQELFAVTPGGTGRWKLRMNREPSALPAAAPDGRLVVPLAGGRIVSVSRHGRILWTLDERVEASAGPVVSSDGNAWIPLTDGRIIAVNPWGETVAEASLAGAVSILALDGIGRIWAGGFNGRVTVFDPGPDPGTDSGAGTGNLGALFELRPSSSRVASILTGPGGDARVFMADGTSVAVDSEGIETDRRRIAVSGGSPSAAADGTLFLPASDGSIRVVPTIGDLLDGEPLELRGESVLAEPLLTEEGILIAGGGDWILYGWRAAPPGPGWRQFRGDSRRSGTFPATPPIPDRLEARRDPGFFFRERMAVSDDLSDRLTVLEELESYPDGYTMRRDMPWADLILEDLAAVGTIRMVDPQNQPLQSHAVIRARAYILISRGEDFRARNLLLHCLTQEGDPAALAAGFRALGYAGTDWDGSSMRLMAARFREFSPAGERLTVETARALADLVRYNGDLSDPSGYDLMDALLKSPLSKTGREEVIAVIRSVASL